MMNIFFRNFWAIILVILTMACGFIPDTIGGTGLHPVATDTTDTTDVVTDDTPSTDIVGVRPTNVGNTDTVDTMDDTDIAPDTGSELLPVAGDTPADTDLLDTTDTTEPVDTDPPWVDTDPPRPDPEQETLVFTKVTDMLFPAGSLESGWSHSPEGEVESHWTTCTQGYPGESPESWVCLFYNKTVTGEVGLFRRLEIAADGTWTWHPLTSGVSDMVAARIIDGPVGIYGPNDPSPGPKLHQLRFARLQDSSGNSRLVLLVGSVFGPVFEPEPAQTGTWRQELTIRDALRRDLGIVQPPTGHSWTWDVNGDGLIDLLLMKERKINMADPSEPTGLVVVYALPGGGWFSKLYGAIGGHNEVYSWQVIGEPGSGPPMITALGSAGPASTEVWEARDVLGLPRYDADGYPSYAQSMALGNAIANIAPMGAAQLDLKRPDGLPMLAIASADSDLCHETFEPMLGLWWGTSAATRLIIPRGTPDARQGKCTWDAASLPSREIPWGTVQLTPHQIVTVWGHDTTQHQQCGEAAIARGYPAPPADCPPAARPTGYWVAPPIPGMNYGELVAYPATQFVVLDQGGAPVSDRNDRFVACQDMDTDGDCDLAIAGAFESEGHVLRNEAMEPRFCVNLIGGGLRTGNNEIGLGAKIVVRDAITQEEQRLWVGHDESCFRASSRDPNRTEVRITWPNSRAEQIFWNGQSPTVTLAE